MASEALNPKPSSLRLMVLAPQPSTRVTKTPPFPAFLKALTGSEASKDQTSFTGYTSHPPLQLRTKYYQSDVGIWCDELPPSSASQSASKDQKFKSPEAQSTDADPDTLEGWIEQMLSYGAVQVRASIGGLVLLLPVWNVSETEVSEEFVTLIEKTNEFLEGIEEASYDRDTASIIVLQGMTANVRTDKLNDMLERLDDTCRVDKGIMGWDFVAWNGAEGEQSSKADDDKRNEYGERTGIKRVIEIVEGIDWTAASILEEDEGDEFGLGDSDSDDGLDFLKTASSRGMGRFSGLDAELQREMMELKLSMGDDHSQENGESAGEDDEEPQVDQFPALIERVVAIREAGSEMSQADREKFARREIAKIMREME